MKFRSPLIGEAIKARNKITIKENRSEKRKQKITQIYSLKALKDRCINKRK